MPHTKSDVIESCNNLIKAIDKQVGIFRGAIAALENAKRGVLMVVRAEEPPLDLSEQVSIRDLAEKMGNGPLGG